MKSSAIKGLKKTAFRKILQQPIKFMKNVKTITVSISYTTRTEPDIVVGKDFIFDVDKTKESISGLFRKGRGELDMAAYQFEIIWLNEMGDEQKVYVETIEERNSKMQALADDGYSPVWREI